MVSKLLRDSCNRVLLKKFPYGKVSSNLSCLKQRIDVALHIHSASWTQNYELDYRRRG